VKDSSSFIYPSPVGSLSITSDGTHITGCAFSGEPAAAAVPQDNVTARCVRELEAYFSGTLKVFTIPIKPSGTFFQLKIWGALTHIPYGETTTYGKLAAQTGNPKAARAVGGANHHNPIVIIIPCHRVIGANGHLTGFGGGLERKSFLLNLENRNKHIS
jgi:methylated-DNA-[protein]-cysteine S-methyltransferase